MDKPLFNLNIDVPAQFRAFFEDLPEDLTPNFGSALPGRIWSTDPDPRFDMFPAGHLDPFQAGLLRYMEFGFKPSAIIHVPEVFDKPTIEEIQQLSLTPNPLFMKTPNSIPKIYKNNIVITGTPTQLRRFAYQLLKNGLNGFGEFSKLNTPKRWREVGLGLKAECIVVIGGEFQFCNCAITTASYLKFTNKTRREALAAALITYNW